VRIERKISLVIDFLALLSLYFLFRRERFELVHSVDPKAGLLSMTASRLAGVPVRIHTFTGQVWGTRGGAMRTLLKCADKVTAMASSAILVDSSSQRDFIVKERVLPAEKAFVLGNGSISGVDIRKFQPSAEFRESIRAKHGIPPHSFVILYMARLTRDKGALVMAGAFSRLAAERPSAQLLVVGPDEESLRPRIRDICRLCQHTREVHGLRRRVLPAQLSGGVRNGNDQCSRCGDPIGGIPNLWEHRRGAGWCDRLSF